MTILEELLIAPVGGTWELGELGTQLNRIMCLRDGMGKLTGTIGHMITINLQ